MPDQVITAVPATNVKRKTREEEDSDDEGSDVSMINVDFDFYNPNPEVDDIALKRLLRQLFTSDAEFFDIHALAQHILTSAGQMGIGTTVKVDGTESDPYAYISLVDLSNIDSKPAVKPLVEYLIARLPTPSPFRTLLQSTSSPQSKTRIALVVSERLVNLPVQLMSPLWKMTIDEVEKAQKEGTPDLDFTHYLLISRVYKMDVGDENIDTAMSSTVTQPSSKKTKKAKPTGPAVTSGLFHYHPEEEFLEQSALHKHTFDFKTSQPRNEESFGVEQKGRISIYDAKNMQAALKIMEDALT